MVTPPQRLLARLSDRQQVSEKCIHLFFELQEPHNWTFQSGQYVSMKVSDRGERRSYSICSAPSNTHGFELLVDTAPQGVGSQFVEHLQPGQEVDVLAPLGVFTLADDPQETSLVCIATGSGIAPFRSMVLELLQDRHDQRPMTLYWGLRYVTDLFWQKEFEDLVQAFGNFAFHPVISRAVDGWTLCRGRVTDCLSVHDLPDHAGYYLCGNATMIHDVQALLAERQVAPEHIHHEKFY